MFILRRVTSELIEINDCLGTTCVVILKEKNSIEFNNKAKAMNLDSDVIKDIHGFVCYNSGADIIPLYKKSHYYIMASDGKTVDNISYK